MKNFDAWNSIKKDIEYGKSRKKYHAGDIWWIQLGINVGFEQDGKNKNFERLVLILKGFNKEACLIVLLTTQYKQNKFYIFVGEFNRRKNYAILSQVRFIDTKRFINQIGFIDKQRLYKIKIAIWNVIR